jgi:hypothetical protein
MGISIHGFVENAQADTPADPQPDVPVDPQPDTPANPQSDTQANPQPNTQANPQLETHTLTPKVAPERVKTIVETNTFGLAWALVMWCVHIHINKIMENGCLVESITQEPVHLFLWDKVHHVGNI